MKALIVIDPGVNRVLPRAEIIAFPSTVPTPILDPQLLVTLIRGTEPKNRVPLPAHGKGRTPTLEDVRQAAAYWAPILELDVVELANTDSPS